MSTDTIISNVTTGVTLASGGAYGNPVTVASGVEVSGSPAVKIVSPWTVTNYGTIDGGPIGILVNTPSGGYTEAWITNAAGGTITATGHGAGIAAGGTITVDNSGLIYSSYRGLSLAGGSVTNEVGGIIDGGSYGILDSTAAATIANHGTIEGVGGDAIKFVSYAGNGVSLIDNTGAIVGQGGNGVYIVQSYAAVTNEAGGTIDSVFTDGVKIKGATSATVSNSGSIHGGTDGVYMGGAAATLENSGTIGGAQYAAYLNASGSNRLIVDAGAVFGGDVAANAAAANTIELTGASAGTLTGLGTHYRGFQTVAIDSGATWDIAGTVAAFDTTAVDGFSSHDRLDLTDLAFNAGDTVSFDDGTNVLTIKDSGGGTLASIQLDDSADGDIFKLVSDGHGGTFAEDSDYTPCFCRGTRIRTPGGEMAVENLRIGDLVVTAAGQALPLKWIGQRFYRDWLAIGNADVQPICFRAGSIADRVPARDLHVSPEHAMFIGGMLVPAKHLVNGISILKVSGMEEIDYFHLEFDRHVVILAEGAAAESFVDDDSRMLFHNADEYRLLYPDEPRRRAEFCAARVESGHALETLRLTLAARAARLRPDRKAARAPVGSGYIDRADRTLVEGWAAGDGPVKLAILVNGAVVGETLADRRRADLKSSGLGDCGFRFVLPRPLAPDLAHRIEVRRTADWSLLHGGSMRLPAARRP